MSDSNLSKYLSKAKYFGKKLTPTKVKVYMSGDEAAYRDAFRKDSENEAIMDGYATDSDAMEKGDPVIGAIQEATAQDSAFAAGKGNISPNSKLKNIIAVSSVVALVGGLLLKGCSGGDDTAVQFYKTDDNADLLASTFNSKADSVAAENAAQFEKMKAEFDKKIDTTVKAALDEQKAAFEKQNADLVAKLTVASEKNSAMLEQKIEQLNALNKSGMTSSTKTMSPPAPGNAYPISADPNVPKTTSDYDPLAALDNSNKVASIKETVVDTRKFSINQGNGANLTVPTLDQGAQRQTRRVNVYVPPAATQKIVASAENRYDPTRPKQGAFSSFADFDKLKPGEQYTLLPGTIPAVTLSGTKAMTGEGALGTSMSSSMSRFNSSLKNIGQGMENAYSAGSEQRLMAERPIAVQIKGYLEGANGYKFQLDNCEAYFTVAAERSTQTVQAMGDSILCYIGADKYIYTSIAGAATLTDRTGQSGLQGRLVSREGYQMSRAFFADFAQGVTGIYQNTNFASGYDQTPNINSSVINRAGGQAFASGANRLTEHLIKLAEDSRPYVEVEAGIPATILLTKPVTLQIQSTYKPSKDTAQAAAPATTAPVKVTAKQAPQAKPVAASNSDPLSAPIETTPPPPYENARAASPKRDLVNEVAGQ